MNEEKKETRFKVNLGDTYFEGEGPGAEGSWSKTLDHLEKRRKESLLVRRAKLLIKKAGIEAAVVEIDKALELWESENKKRKP